MDLPVELRDALFDNTIISEELYLNQLEEVKNQIMYPKSEYAKDVNLNVINIGDFLGKYENGDINVYVVCAESSNCFYLARYFLLEAFDTNNISSVDSIIRNSSTRVSKKNCHKTTLLSDKAINPLIVDKMIKLREKIIEFYNG